MSGQQDVQPPPPGVNQQPPPGDQQLHQGVQNAGGGQLPPPGAPVQPQQFGGPGAPAQPPQFGGPGFVGFPQGQGFGGQVNWGGLAAMPGQYAVNGHGMQNVQFNANFALNAANLAEQQARLAMQNCNNLAKSFAKNERWSRDLKINQEMVKYKTPGDKKGVKYLMEEQFDLKELQ